MDQDLLWCEDCKKAVPGDCTLHGPLQHLPDRPVSPRAVKTAPKVIEILPITQADDDAVGTAVGAFATCNIPARTCFGPFQADTVSLPPQVGPNRLLLKRFQAGKECGYLDVTNDYVCNWLIYVRPAHHHAQINVIVFLYKDEIYFCTSRMVPVQQELRVWYSDEYSRLLGVRPEDSQAIMSVVRSMGLYSLWSSNGHAEVARSSSRLSVEASASYSTDDRSLGRRKARRPQRIPQALPSSPAKNAHTHNASPVNPDPSPSSLLPLLPLPPSFAEDFAQSARLPTHSLKREIESTSVLPLLLGRDSDDVWTSGANGHNKWHRSREDSVGDDDDEGDRNFRANYPEDVDEDEEGLISEYARSPQSSSVDSEHDGTMGSCSDCGKQFTTLESMQEHAKLHAGSRPHVCSFPFCRKFFTSKYKLLRHELIHSQEKRHHCPLCHKKFHRKDHLNNHLKVHERSKVRLECHLCGCVFAKKWTYEKHMTLHERDGSHKLDSMADFCRNGVGSSSDESQREQSSLLLHPQQQLLMSGVTDHVEDDYLPYKPEPMKRLPVGQKASHPCDVCGKVFSASKDLRRHLQTHLGVKPNLCPYCPKKFTRKDHVRRHVMTVHADCKGVELLLGTSRSSSSNNGNGTRMTATCEEAASTSGMEG
ncbi:putative Zinc finger protein PLAGL1 [Hypsibius exemplaris]|uniref:Zinc finger protein PLAGL1 n=1 Tax=Hypsibius exemplaris TaxID=2072580 RepID=A0A1W0X6A7_HYPEX|nr:putative Zinc finger protein PLAGL1 [Hypsibius exemplaris]